MSIEPKKGQVSFDRNELERIEEILNSKTLDFFHRKIELEKKFEILLLKERSLSEVIKFVQHFHDNSLNREIIHYLKYKKSSFVAGGLAREGELNLARSFANQLLTYCEQNKIYSNGLVFLQEQSENIFSRKLINSHMVRLKLCIGDTSCIGDNLPAEVLELFLRKCYEKKSFSLDLEICESLIGNNEIITVTRHGSPKTLLSLLCMSLGYLGRKGAENKVLMNLTSCLMLIRKEHLIILQSHEEDDERKKEKIRGLINKSKVILNLNRKDLLASLLEEIKDLDKENAWLKYLEMQNTSVLSEKERKEIVKSYQHLNSGDENITKDRMLRKQIKELLEFPEKVNVSDVYFMGFVLEEYDLCLEISERAIGLSKSEKELVSGIVLKIKALMSLKKWLKANDYIDQVFEELPLRSEEKQTILKLKIECLENLEFHAEAETGRRELRSLESGY